MATQFASLLVTAIDDAEIELASTAEISYCRDILSMKGGVFGRAWSRSSKVNVAGEAGACGGAARHQISASFVDSRCSNSYPKTNPPSTRPLYTVQRSFPLSTTPEFISAQCSKWVTHSLQSIRTSHCHSTFSTSATRRPRELPSKLLCDLSMKLSRNTRWRRFIGTWRILRKVS